MAAWCLALSVLVSPAAALEETLDPNLEPLRPFLGKTFRGEFADSTPEKPVVDVVRYERAMNGKAVRSLHSINDGEYGGETLIYWDSERKTLAFFYLTTAGFRTEGTIIATERKFSSLETVKGNAGGVTEVRGTATLHEDGTMTVVADYKRGDTWQKARETLYKPSPSAVVKFR